MSNYQIALEAIQDIFSDTVVSREETIETLEDLAGEIEMLIECIRADIRRSER